MGTTARPEPTPRWPSGPSRWIRAGSTAAWCPSRGRTGRATPAGRWVREVPRVMTGQSRQHQRRHQHEGHRHGQADQAEPGQGVAQPLLAPQLHQCSHGREEGDGREADECCPRVAEPGPVGGLEHVEGVGLVLDLLGEVPEVEGGRHRIGPVHEAAEVLFGPAGDPVGDRLTRGRVGHPELGRAPPHPRRVLGHHPLDPSRRRVPGHDDVVEALVLGVVAGLLADVGLGPGAEVVVDLVEGGADGLDEERFRVGHPQRDGVGSSRELREVGGPHRVGVGRIVERDAADRQRRLDGVGLRSGGRIGHHQSIVGTYRPPVEARRRGAR